MDASALPAFVKYPERQRFVLDVSRSLNLSYRQADFINMSQVSLTLRSQHELKRLLSYHIYPSRIRCIHCE